jgi:hypothetical protein
MIGIEQQLDGPIVDGLYASLNSSYPPSTSNKFLTDDDVTSGGITIPADGEILWTADVTDTRSVAGAMLPVFSMAYPINANVVNGRSRRITIVANYSKTVVAATTTAFQVVAGGISLTLNTETIGNPARTNDTYFIEIIINFRSANQAHMLVNLLRSQGSGNPLSQLYTKTIALGTWDKTIANTIVLNWQIVTNTLNVHTLTIQQVTSALI